VNTLAGRYRLLAVLGRGGMGVVWRARDERLDRDVAVKVLHAWVADDPDLRRRFEDEARVLAGLQHTHVVRLYDVARHEGNAVLVMELVEGESFATLVRGGRRLPWATAAALCRPIAEALAYAHERGVVHRDLTAANVLVESASGRVVVSDFGLARLLRASPGTPGSTLVAGTPEYWSPEQAAGRTPDAATDVYALGCLLFRLLTGRLPFEDDDRLAAGLRRVHEDAPRVATAAEDLPPEACALVDSMLARARDRRPTALEVARRLDTGRQALHAALPAEGRGVPAEGATLVAPTQVASAGTMRARRLRPYRAISRARVAVAAFVLAAVLAVSGGAVYALAGREPPGISAPQLVGKTLVQARARVAAAAKHNGVAPPHVRVTSRGYSERRPAGTILAQDHSAGTHVPSSERLGVRLSLGSSRAAVPAMAGAEPRDAVRDLAAAGFRPVRRYGPSRSTPAWRVARTDPPAGTNVRRPARVVVLVSTGPPRVAVPDVRGEDRGDGLDRLERAGLAVRVEEAPSTSADPGAILEVSPAPRTRTPIGTTVTVVVAREPRWDVVRSADGNGDYATRPIVVEKNSRVVLAVDNTSFLGLFAASVDVSWAGDSSDRVEVDSGNAALLLEPVDERRTVAFTLRTHGSVRWTLRIEKLV
jgi:beta-lactam-binding protein with PASTA domain/predicted Ser/Thr protein kinase